MRRRALLATAAIVALSLLTAARTPRPHGRPAGGEADSPPPADDYGLDNKKWNGLSDLRALAGNLGLTLEARGEVDWSELAGGDVLFVIYPTVRLDPVRVAGFIRQGGRVLIGDDFGKSDEALARLGILRHPAQGVSPSGFYQGNPNLPIAVPSRDGHPLALGVNELITNHPAVFSVSPGSADAVLGYGPGEAVVVAGQLGEGRFVALADPSVLINDMLAFDGNLAFALNLLRYLGVDQSRIAGKVVVVSREFSLEGDPPGALDDVQPKSGLNPFLADLGQWLDELNDYLAPDPILRGLGALVAGLVVVLVTGWAALGRRRELDANFARMPVEKSPYERVLAELTGGRARKNYALPAAILREQAEAQLAQLFQRKDLGAEETNVLGRAARLLGRVPTRAEVAAHGGRVSEAELIALHDAVRAAAAAPPGQGERP